ncbi:MAG: hypothetical protein A3G00_03020 [Candidatus Magasanikbacteria bacterium RIFCSPLOWO2_12_FULL_43_12]|uniref:Dephospho-CoA kinase n=1 Tax=Candidatus Magasanikbacteria bacterium RIFCSPLOWO2_12_FULL_43_12 TaxID=1798692 RepID=A0A1F6MRL2_9BACT|nr:MAG: hypothetical protein A3C74_01860 [Candidatus Magasanikbacteria bacterium RIFCSPHIGHO2_02_FULL_44_13]OGH72484.1 MAG: hypothetical protein A3I93_02650 [Candidatus Magasanikbacteria bacterium RIFCSPLOWO2_02_FULL_43_22]OGH74160.1 MAG: hypothetical protein A3G00_03020 [Candidatus Magasanikbacteria bacterium RIFCSPLOWO2_12_FULL_43_12]
MTNNKKHIFVFVGMAGSGKNTCTNYLHTKYAADIFSFTTMLKDVISRFYLEFNRDNLIKLSEAVRAIFGEDLLAKTMAKDVENASSNMIAIDNARRLADIKYLSQLPGFVLIEIAADMKTRFERISKRGEKTSDAQTFEQFVAEHQRPTELSIFDLAKHATEHINNDGNSEQLYAQVDELVKKYS